MSIPQSAGGAIESRDDLIRHLAEGSKPKSEWRIGTEHEKFVYDLKTMKPVGYEGKPGIRALLEGMRRFGWEPVLEGDYIIGLTQNGASISLEPGGQFELSGAPLKSVHETCNEVNTHLEQVRELADEMGVGVLGLGYAPNWRLDEVPQMPKGRYNIMRNYMPKVGGYGLEMMFRTCTVQVNLDFSSEADMVKKFRVGLALQPVATALFANSPFREGRANGFLSYRSQIWTDVDNARSGMLPFVFESGFGFEQYVDYALNVPMYFVYRAGQIYRRGRQEFPRLPRREHSRTEGHHAHDGGLGGSSDDDLPRSAAQEISRNARRRRRLVAAHLRPARALGRHLLRPGRTRCGMGHGERLERGRATGDARRRCRSWHSRRHSAAALSATSRAKCWRFQPRASAAVPAKIPSARRKKDSCSR